MSFRSTRFNDTELIDSYVISQQLRSGGSLSSAEQVRINDFGREFWHSTLQITTLSIAPI
jgi:hypothetical protein